MALRKGQESKCTCVSHLAKQPEGGVILEEKPRRNNRWGREGGEEGAYGFLLTLIAMEAPMRCPGRRRPDEQVWSGRESSGVEVEVRQSLEPQGSGSACAVHAACRQEGQR